MNTPAPMTPAAPVELRHSGVGISSFVCGLFALIATFVTLGWAGMVHAQSGGAGIDEKSPLAVMIGLALFAEIFLGVIAVALGIGSLFQNRKKVFGVLGLLFGLAQVAGTAGIIAFGMSMQQ
jgi:hypothetical protein